MRFLSALFFFLLCNTSYADETLFDCQETIIEAKGIYLYFLAAETRNLAEKYRYDTTNQILSIGDTELSCSSYEQLLTCNRLDEDEDYFYKWHFQIDTASLKNEFRKQGEFANKEHLIHTQGECLISN